MTALKGKHELRQIQDQGEGVAQCEDLGRNASRKRNRDQLRLGVRAPFRAILCSYDCLASEPVAMTLKSWDTTRGLD